MTTLACDIAVIGSGFGGSLTAAIARRLGRSVVLLERGTHPRFAMGESSTPLTNLMLEELTTRYDLPNLSSLAKWGTWQRAHPEIACGLKRGFTFYHHQGVENQSGIPNRQQQLLVAASPRDAIADTHWYRADFDHLFVREAQAAGVSYMDEVQLESAEELGDEMHLRGKRSNAPLHVRAKLVIDASGPRGFLHRALGLGESPLPSLPATQALFSHFSGVERIEEITNSGSQLPPYPVDDAAVHHVFDGGWIWVLRFNNGITSAGVAATSALSHRLQFSEGEASWKRLLESMPLLQQQFAASHIERPFTFVPNLSFRSSKIVGRRWLLLPSAAGFVDPLLSTGFALTLLGVSRIAEGLERDWGTPRFETALRDYAEQTEKELCHTARLLGSLYWSMGDFPLFASLTLLYFAAVIYSETSRRLGRPHQAPGFLLCDHPGFAQRCVAIFDRVQAGEASQPIRDEILRTIEPINLAGLGDPKRANWYPVDTDDLYRAAWKVGATHQEILAMLERCEFRESAEHRAH